MTDERPADEQSEDNDQPEDDQSKYDVDSLRVTRDEARDVLDQQTDAISEIHDKGVHVLRLNVLVLSVVLTLTSILVGSATTPGVGPMTNGFLLFGVLASILSMLTALWAYSSTSFRAGAGPSDIRTFLRRTPSEDEWLAALLYNYAAWMELNEQATRRNAVVLFVSHVFLFLAMAYYAAGFVVGSYFGRMNWLLSFALAVCYGIVVVGVLVVPSWLLGRNRSRSVENRT